MYCTPKNLGDSTLYLSGELTKHSIKYYKELRKTIINIRLNVFIVTEFNQIFLGLIGNTVENFNF